MKTTSWVKKMNVVSFRETNITYFSFKSVRNTTRLLNENMTTVLSLDELGIFLDSRKKKVFDMPSLVSLELCYLMLLFNVFLHSGFRAFQITAFFPSSKTDKLLWPGFPLIFSLFPDTKYEVTFHFPFVSYVFFFHLRQTRYVRAGAFLFCICF